MKNFTATTSKFGFLFISFLVLALTCITLFISRYNKNSDQLDSTVKDLAGTHSKEERIDSALALLYIAENNARMYALYGDSVYYNTYRSQMTSVTTLLAALQNSGDDEEALGTLIADKRQKTQLFLQAQAVIDSILLKGDSIHPATARKVVFHKPPRVNTARYESTDTSVVNGQPEKKKTKGLFGRLSDAIRNKQETGGKVVDKVLVNRFAKDSVKMHYENMSLQMQVSDFKSHQKDLDNLKNKEKAVLDANHRLFENLQDLLQEIKKEELLQRQSRTQLLGKHAYSLTKNLKVNSKYITAFSILLSLVILFILFLLYKNELALKKAKRQAEDYARLKSEFTATMSHEIRTPLHSIHAFADELNPKDDRAHQSEIIDAIKLSSGMLLSVVNNILDFTKIEKGKFRLEYLPFNPAAVINEILAGLKIQAKQKNLTLTGMLDSSVDRQVYGDAFQLRQILLNIVSNAIKYTEKGNVTVSANTVNISRDKMTLQIHVADTGSGIAQKDIPHLFEEFSSNAHRSEIVAGSSGLGLNIVKKIVDLHRGTISVKSTLEKGTTFAVELPYNIKEDTKQAKENLPVKQQEVAGKIKILLVENDTFNQKFLMQLLGKQDTSVQVAADAETALKLIGQEHFDLVLTDIGLPKMSGTALAGHIRRSGTGNAGVIIFGLTGFDRDEIKYDSGHFNEWFVKPFKSTDLLEKINRYFPGKISV